MESAVTMEHMPEFLATNADDSRFPQFQLFFGEGFQGVFIITSPEPYTLYVFFRKQVRTVWTRCLRMAYFQCIQISVRKMTSCTQDTTSATEGNS